MRWPCAFEGSQQDTVDAALVARTAVGYIDPGAAIDVSSANVAALLPGASNLAMWMLCRPLYGFISFV